MIRDLTCDKFGLVIDARDPRFREEEIHRDLAGEDLIGVDLLYEVRPSRFFSEQIFSVRFLLLLAAVSFTCVTATRLIWKYGGLVPPFDFMKAQTKLNPQQPSSLFPDGSGMRPPVPGTVARNLPPYPYGDDPEGAGAHLVNPIPLTEEALERGKKQYEIFCRHCHGPRARGNGYLTPAFPRAPSLHSSKVKNWPDGRIYHVITAGQNAMPSHARQISRDDRWRIIHYLRALQRSLDAPDRDLQ